jgi:hypothetical protein
VAGRTVGLGGMVVNGCLGSVGDRVVEMDGEEHVVVFVQRIWKVC